VIGGAGIALFVSLALGGPLGSAMYAGAGLQRVSVFTLLISLESLGQIWRRPGPLRVPQITAEGPMVLAAVARAGVASGLAGFAYTALAFFSVLLFLDRGSAPTWAPFSVCAVALILMRTAVARLPDRMGAPKTALVLLFVQMAGLAAMTQGAAMGLALVGSFVAGIGYAFIYPALGREAVRSVAPERVGRALGYYSALLDLSLRVSGLLLGQVADRVGPRRSCSGQKAHNLCRWTATPRPCGPKRGTTWHRRWTSPTLTPQLRPSRALPKRWAVWMVWRTAPGHSDLPDSPGHP
jgi:hypothetical protein